jgi:hypothetical protein
MFTIQERKELRQLKLRLLCETDYQTLLDACRELSKRANKGDLEYGRYNIRIHPDPEASQFPQLILKLTPNYVFINKDGRVIVEMLGGLIHFGVYAYPENYKYEGPINSFGDKELIHGLWYYDDGYQETPDYGKKIDAFIEKYKKKQKR